MKRLGELSIRRTHRIWLTTHEWRLGAAAIAVLAVASLGGGAAVVAGASPSSPPTASPVPSAPLILDGEAWIAYDSFTRCQASGCSGIGIWLVRPDGTGNHMITTDRETGLHPDWSPDGTQLAFTVLVGDAGRSIWVMDADGSNARQVLACDPPCMDIDDPAWSPKGTRLAFRRYLGATGARVDATDIGILDLATGAVHTVLTGGDVEGYGHPRWSSDANSLVVSVQRYNADQSEMIGSAVAVAVVNAAGPFPASPRILTDWGVYADYPDWHPTDDLIVFTTRDLATFQQTDEPTNLHTIHSDGTDLADLTDFGRADSRATQPTWTPDGGQIIFTLVGQEPGPYDNPRRIALIDADGSHLTQVLGDASAPVNEITAGGHIYGTHPRLRPTP